MAQSDGPDDPDRRRPFHRRVPTPDYLAVIQELRAEQERRHQEKEQDRENALQERRDRRLWKRNAALALFLAIMFNNPSAWLKALWIWITEHVSIH